MTYRTKRLIRRILIALGIAAGALALIFLLVFFYIGRYQVFTDDGVVFDTADSTAAEASPRWTLGSGDAALVTGSPIFLGSAEDDSGLIDTDVSGVLYDYEDVEDGAVLAEYDFSELTNNMIVLEMRKEGVNIENTPAVESFISSAKEQNIRMAALISCLDDSAYALAHQPLGLAIEGGALFMSSDGSYWLNPLEEDVQTYLADIITDLYNLGFDEVILDNFDIPAGAGTQIDTEGDTLDDLLIQAYNSLLSQLPQGMAAGLLITDPAEGHPCQDTARRLYVCYSSGASAATYAAAHETDWFVFVTDSHDTRFDEFGKIFTTRELDIPDPEEEDEETDEEYETEIVPDAEA